VITGGLAADGYDLTLVARRRDRLDGLAAKLAGNGPCTVEVHVADLTDPGGLRSAEDLIAATPRLNPLPAAQGIIPGRASPRRRRAEAESCFEP
jgi:NADP-dependent 3-hydroxy acid dehydrogenase YdfG